MNKKTLSPPPQIVDSTRLLIKSKYHLNDEMLRLFTQLLLNPMLNLNIEIIELRRRNDYILIKLNQSITIKSLDDLQNRARLILVGLQLSLVKEPDTLRVCNLSQQCSKELLNLYFSNEKFTGPGDVKSIKYFHFENKAIVQFANSKQVEYVLQQKHLICDRECKLEKYYDLIENEHDDLETTSTSDNSKSDSIDRTKLILSNLNETTSIQHIDFLIQLITDRADIASIEWSLTFKHKLMITFAKEINLDKVFHLYETHFNKLNTKKFQLETVNKTTKLIILVKKLKLQLNDDFDDYKPETIPVTRDLLELYFTNRLRSGANGYKKIERITCNYWMIDLTSSDTLKSILTRQHILDEKPFYLYPFYNQFGLPYLCDTTQFRLKLKYSKLKYLNECQDLLVKLDSLLSEANCKLVKLNQQDVVYLEYVNRVLTRVPYTEKIWRLRCKQTIDYFCQYYKYNVLNLTINQWRLVDTRLKLIDLKSDEFFKFENDLYLKLDMVSEEITVQIIIWGSIEKVDKLSSKIRDLICQVYFNLSNEEKLIRLVTYLKECQDLLNEWQVNKDEITFNARESRLHTINEMILKLDKDQLDLEFDYENLFRYRDDAISESDDTGVDSDDADDEKAENTIESETERIKLKLNNLKLRIANLKQQYNSFYKNE